MIRDDIQALVIENGSRTSKAGFVGEDSPRAVFQTITGRPQYKVFELIVSMALLIVYVKLRMI